MGPDAWDIDIHTEKKPARETTSLSAAAIHSANTWCPQPKSSHRLPGRIAALTAS